MALLTVECEFRENERAEGPEKPRRFMPRDARITGERRRSELSESPPASSCILSLDDSPYHGILPILFSYFKLEPSASLIEPAIHGHKGNERNPVIIKLQCTLTCECLPPLPAQVLNWSHCQLVISEAEVSYRHQYGKSPLHMIVQ